MTDSTICAIGERNGMVVMSFPRPVTEFTIDAEQARQMAEQFARSAHKAHTGNAWPTPSKSAVSEALRKRLHARASIVARTLIEQGKSPAYIARHMVDIILTEVV